MPIFPLFCGNDRQKPFGKWDHDSSLYFTTEKRNKGRYALFAMALLNFFPTHSFLADSEEEGSGADNDGFIRGH